MYDTNITNPEVKIFHDLVNITAGYEELNNLASGALFDKTKNNKIIPKFYSEEITGNESLRIIENKLVIYTDTDDLDSLYFIGEKSNINFDVFHESVTLNNKTFLTLHFYDETSLFSLAGFNFNVKQSGDNGVNVDVVSDDYGNVNIPLKTGTGTFTVTCTENGQVRSW